MKTIAISLRDIEKLHQSKEYGISSVVREYVIVLFYDFIELRKGLNCEPIMKTKPMLDSCLEPFWGPVFDYKEVIEQLRHGYLCHAGKDGFPELLLPEYVQKAKIFGNMGDLQFLIYCVIGYTKYVGLNFKGELQTAINTIPDKEGKGILGKLNYESAKTKIDEIEGRVIEDLRRNNLVSENNVNRN